MKCRNKGGFTLLEILLSVALMAVIATVSIPVFQSFQVRNDLSIASTTVAQGLRRAQAVAESSDGDTSSGVRIQSGRVTVFRGTNYAGRDAAYDEVFDVPTSISFSGVSEVVFSKFTGIPTITGTITLTSSINETKTVTINEKGTIIY